MFQNFAVDHPRLAAVSLQERRGDYYEVARHRPAPDAHIELIGNLTNVSSIRYDDQKIKIAVRSGAPFDGRTEKKDTLRPYQTHDLRHDLSNATLYVDSCHAGNVPSGARNATRFVLLRCARWAFILERLLPESGGKWAEDQ